MVSRRADILQMSSDRRSTVLAQKFLFSVCLLEVNFSIRN